MCHKYDTQTIFPFLSAQEIFHRSVPSVCWSLTEQEKCLGFEI